MVLVWGQFKLTKGCLHEPYHINKMATTSNRALIHPMYVSTCLTSLQWDYVFKVRLVHKNLVELFMNAILNLKNQFQIHLGASFEIDEISFQVLYILYNTGKNYEYSSLLYNLFCLLFFKGSFYNDLWKFFKRPFASPWI